MYDSDFTEKGFGLIDNYFQPADRRGVVPKRDKRATGHGMIRDMSFFMWELKRQAALTQTPPIFTAHSDMSGISLFEEAYSHGIAAAENALTYLNLAYQSEL